MAIPFKELSPHQMAVANTIADEAVRQGVDPDLMLAQAYQESGFNHLIKREGKMVPNVSDQGAFGAMQILPTTAGEKFDPSDLKQNVEHGVSLMKSYIDKYKSPELALLAYHQGEGTADKYAKTNDMKVLGDKGIDYVLQIGKNYDFGQFSQPKGKEDTEDYRTYAAPKEKMGEDESILQQAVPGASLGLPAAYAQWKLNRNKEAELNKAREAEMKAKSSQVPPTEEELAGDKWSRKVVGSQGPGGESVTEAAKNYQIQKGLEGGERVNRAGIILPVGAQEEIKRTEQQQEQEQQRQQQAQATEDAKLQNRIGRGALNLAKYLRYSPVTNIAGGLGTTLNVKEARKRYEEGDTLGAGISGLNALFNAGALIPLSPNVYGDIIKGGSLVGSAAMTPIDIAYRQYRATHPIKKQD